MSSRGRPRSRIKDRLSYIFESFFFCEVWPARILRLALVIFLILGWGWFWVVITSTDVDPWNVVLVRWVKYCIVPVAAMIGGFLVGAAYLRDIYELDSFPSSLRFLVAAAFDGPPSGLFLPQLEISHGRTKVEDSDGKLIEKIGGPGWLYIQPGNAVVLERLESPSAVLGAGMHFITRFQRIKGIISLEDQHRTAPPFGATTRDGIRIRVEGFQFGYKLYADRRHDGSNRRTMPDPYPFSTGAARTLMYDRSVMADGQPMEWGRNVQFRVDGAITDQINKSHLDQLYAPRVSDDPRETIVANIESPKTRNMLKNMLGTELLWYKIGQFEIEDPELSEKIKAHRLNMWYAQWQGNSKIVHAQGTAEMISQEESGRTETTAVMLKSIVAALKETRLSSDSDQNLWSIVLARTAQIIESLTSLYGHASETAPLQKKMGDDNV